MFKKEKKAKDIEHKNVLVGRVGLSQMNVSIMPEGDIHLQEFFIDPDYVQKNTSLNYCEYCSRVALKPPNNRLQWTLRRLSRLKNNRYYGSRH